MSLQEIMNYIEKSKSVEIKVEGDKIIVSEYKGISKTDVSDVKSLIRSKKSKIDKKRIKIISELIPILLNNKISFKIILEKDPLLKFDVERYIAITPNEAKIFGFNSEKESPLNMIWQKLKENLQCVFYKPVK
jgi:predicted site-specific integrase-resolvase